MRRKNRPSTLIAILILGLLAAIYFYRERKTQEPEPAPAPVSGKLAIHFLDIGQGDCQLIQLPGGENVLIDSGDRGAPTEELLKQYGVRQIDLIIATHPHADHIGDMRDVMRAFPVKEFWDSGFPHPTKTYTEMLQEIKNRGIKFSTPKQGETRRIGDVLIEVLHPPPDRLPDDNPNNSSIVVRVSYGGKRFLFTGDSEVESWEQMLASEKEKLRADLLKAAHHGSSNGTTAKILDAVRPAFFTISCAVGNDYHHPHPKVMEALERRRNDIRVYRTDLQGTLTALCDGNTIEVQTEKQISQDHLYLTGDEAAAKVASGGSRGGASRRRAAGGSR